MLLRTILCVPLGGSLCVFFRSILFLVPMGLAFVCSSWLFFVCPLVVVFVCTSGAFCVCPLGLVLVCPPEQLVPKEINECNRRWSTARSICLTLSVWFEWANFSLPCNRNVLWTVEISFWSDPTLSPHRHYANKQGSKQASKQTNRILITVGLNDVPSLQEHTAALGTCNNKPYICEIN